MKRIEYKTGQRIGKCMYLYDIFKSNKIRYAKFICQCGNEFEADIQKIKSGHTKSCGCLVGKKGTHGLSQDPLYRIWADIKNRCTRTNYFAYKYYGARGITICDEWKNDFKAFYDYVVELPRYNEKGMTLDRERNGDGYKPGNLRWVSMSVQGANRRMRIDNTSGYTGVFYYKDRDQWFSLITINKNRTFFGYFDNKEDALQARNKFIINNKLNNYKVQ